MVKKTFFDFFESKKQIGQFQVASLLKFKTDKKILQLVLKQTEGTL